MEPKVMDLDRAKMNVDYSEFALVLIWQKLELLYRYRL